MDQLLPIAIRLFVLSLIVERVTDFVKLWLYPRWHKYLSEPIRRVFKRDYRQKPLPAKGSIQYQRAVLLMAVLVGIAVSYLGQFDAFAEA